MPGPQTSKHFQNADHKSQGTCLNHCPSHLSLSPSSLMIWQFWELFRESQDSLCQPQLFRAQPNLLTEPLCHNNNVATVHLHLLQRSLTIPRRGSIKESARGITSGDPWVAPRNTGKRMPARPTARGEGKQARAAGWEAREGRESQDVPGTHARTPVWEKRAQQGNVKQTTHVQCEVTAVT